MITPYNRHTTDSAAVPVCPMTLRGTVVGEVIIEPRQQPLKVP